MRTETRQERYRQKALTAKTFPVEIACVNLENDKNLSFVSRNAACFGSTVIHCIGSVPNYKDLMKKSGGQAKLVKIEQYRHPIEFLQHIRETGKYLISLELTDTSENLYTTNLPMDQTIVVAIGNETLGVDPYILKASQRVIQIPIMGAGYCLNCAQAAGIFLGEYTRRFYFSN